MIYVFMMIAVMIGSLMPVQAGLNAQLTQLLKHPYLGAFISLTSGALAVGLLIILKGIGFNELKRLTDVPPHLFLGGLLGALFVGSSLFLIPKMGATSMIAAFITGQLIGSVLIDSFGFFGLETTPINFQRIIGIFFLSAGVLLILRKSA